MRKNARPRVLLIDLGGHFGGVENYLTNLSYLVRDHVSVYALCVLPELSRNLSAAGVRVIRLPIFAGALKPLRFLAALLILPLLLLRFRINVVQVNGFLESALMLLVRMLGRSTVYTRHGPFELEQYSWKTPLKLIPRRIARFSIRYATRVVCVSEAVAASVRPLLSLDRYCVIPNWVSLPRPFDRRQNSTSLVKVLCASRLERYKGIHLLIEAAREMPDVQVTIAGEGSSRASLQELAGGAENIRFVGFQRDLERLYQDADIAVMPSMGPEGLPMTSLEAMAHGLPCIFSDIPVHREITDNGKGALLFQSGDVKSLAAALRQLSTDPEPRRSLATEASRIIASRYTADCVRAAYLRVLAC